MINLDVITALVAHDRVADQFAGPTTAATAQRPRVRRGEPAPR